MYKRDYRNYINIDTLHFSVYLIIIIKNYIKMAQENGRKILDVTHISSRGSSYRITLPKKVAAKLSLSSDDDIIIFYQEEEGKISLEKLKHQ